MKVLGFSWHLPRRAISKCHFSLSLPPPDAICCRLNLGHSLVVFNNFFLDLHLEHLVDGVPVKASSSSATHASPAPPASSHPRLFSPPRPTSNTISSRIDNCLLSSDLIIHRFYICKECFPGFKVSVAPLQNIVWVFHSNSGSFQLHNFTKPLLFRTTVCHS